MQIQRENYAMIGPINNKNDPFENLFHQIALQKDTKQKSDIN